MTYNYTVNASDSYDLYDDIPIPKKITKKLGPRPTKYPWEAMKVGQCFLVHHRNKHGSSVAGAGNARAKLHNTGKRYIGRPYKKGFMVWRIE